MIFTHWPRRRVVAVVGVLLPLLLYAMLAHRTRWLPRQHQAQYPISTLTFAADGKSLVSGGFDGKGMAHLEWLDVPSLFVTRTVNDRGVTVSSDLKRVASSDNRVRLQLYDVMKNQVVSRVFWSPENHDYPSVVYSSGIAFSPQGDTIAVGELSEAGGHGWLSLWRVQGQTPQEMPGEENLDWELRVSCITFSSDGKRVLVGSDEGALVMCNSQSYKTFWEQMARSKEPKASKTYAATGVSAVAFAPDSQLVASGHNDNLVCLWSATTGKLTKILRGHAQAVQTVAFAPDGSLASGSDDGNIFLWNVQTGQKIRTFKAQHGAVTALAFSPDGAILASGYKDGTLTLWRIR